MSKGSKRRPQSITDEEFEQRWNWVFEEKPYLPPDDEIVFRFEGEEIMRFTSDGKFYCKEEELQTAGEVYEVLKNWASTQVVK